LHFDTPTQNSVQTQNTEEKKNSSNPILPVRRLKWPGKKKKKSFNDRYTLFYLPI
jgi:hypothetical protein